MPIADKKEWLAEMNWLAHHCKTRTVDAYAHFSDEAIQMPLTML